LRPGSPAATAVLHAPALTHTKAVSGQLRRWFIFLIKFAAGLGMVAFLLWRYQLRSTFQLMQRESPVLFLVTIALYVAGQAMSAVRWQLLAALNGLGGRFSDYIAYYFIGMFTNVFVPGLVGGDALRALYLGRQQRKIGPAFASVIADRGIGLLTL